MTTAGGSPHAGSTGATGEERYRAFVEQSAEGVWCFEVDPPVPTEWPVERQLEAFYERSTLTECNDALARMYKAEDRGQLLGARLADFLPAENEANLAYLREFVARDYRYMDAESQEQDRLGGTHYYLNNLVGVVEHGALVRVWGTQRDITRIKELEAQLSRSQRLESLGMLAGSVAHDFNNLLGVILSCSELALEATAEGDPRREDLEQVQEAGRRATELTRQLLAFGRQQPLRPSALDLNEVVEGTASILRRLLPTGCELVLDLSDRLGTVRADKGQLEQVLMNLVVNARDAMPNGGTITVSTQDLALHDAGVSAPVSSPSGRFVRVAVTDTGTGMDEATQQRIFEPFFTTKEQGKGTGLGLATAWGIISQSGGHLRVSSAPGRGTTIQFLLPVAVD